MIKGALVLICVLISKLGMISSFFVTSASKCNHGMILTRRYLKTNILVVGKKSGTENFIADGYAEYEKRLSNSMSLNTIFYKQNEDLVQGCRSLKGEVYALDEKGEVYTSREFSEILWKSYEEGGASVNFIIGGFNGLPDEIRNKYKLISLSR